MLQNIHLDSPSPPTRLTESPPRSSRVGIPSRPAASPGIRLALAITILLVSPGGGRAGPGDVLERHPVPLDTPTGITRNPENGHYFVSEFLGGRIIELAPDLRTTVQEFPVPFHVLDTTGDLAFDSRSGTLWVVNSSSRGIHEITPEGEATGRVMHPLLLPNPPPLTAQNPVGLCYHDRGDDGRGSFFLVETRGTLIYELTREGTVIRQFGHPDDPDGHPGMGGSAGANDIEVILDAEGELEGFYVNGFDRHRDHYVLRRLDAEGSYTGYFLPLDRLGGIPGSFLLEASPEPDDPPTILGLVQTTAELVRFVREEFALPEIVELTCQVQAEGISLNWNLLTSYDSLEVHRNGHRISTLSGEATEFLDPRPLRGRCTYRITGRRGVDATTSAPCSEFLGPGQILRQEPYPGDGLADMTTTPDGRLWCVDFVRQSLLVFSSELEFIEEIPVLPYPEPEHRLSGLAFRPETGTLLVFNSTTSELREINFFGEAEDDPIPVEFPTGPRDAPPSIRSLVGMTYLPPSGETPGQVVLLENRHHRIYRISLEGEVVAGIDNPDYLESSRRGNLNPRSTTTGVAHVPGSSPPRIDLTGGVPSRGDAPYAFRLDPETLERRRGTEISLEEVERSCPDTRDFALASHGTGDGFRLYTGNIQFGETCVSEIDSTADPLVPITDFECSQGGERSEVRLTFSINDAYDGIIVHRNRELLTTLGPQVSEFVDPSAPVGLNTYELTAFRGALTTTSTSCTLRVGTGALLEERVLDVTSPGQVTRDPRTGVFYLVSKSISRSRSVHLRDAGFDLLPPLLDLLPEPYQIDTLAMRHPVDESPRLHLIISRDADRHGARLEYYFRVIDTEGELVSETRIHPPHSGSRRNPFPAGLLWNPETDSFFYTERSLDRIIELSPEGHVLDLIPNPLRPTDPFVFDFGLSLYSPGGGFLVPSARPGDREITHVGHLSPAGRPTGFVLEFSGTPLVRIQDIEQVGNRLVVVGDTDFNPVICELELHDDLVPVSGLEWTREAGAVHLSWDPSSDRDGIVIFRDGEKLTELPGNETDFRDETPGAAGAKIYALFPRREGEQGPWTVIEEPRDGVPEFFLRGDVDGSHDIDISDPIGILTFLFLGNDRITCYDAADSNDDGRIDITDVVTLLSVQFLGVGQIPPPGPAVGPDPTPDDLTCTAILTP